MATTIAPLCPSLPLKYRWKKGARNLLAIFYDAYVEDVRNTDKCSSMDDHSYYCGRIDVEREVIFGLTGKWLP